MPYERLQYPQKRKIAPATENKRKGVREFGNWHRKNVDSDVLRSESNRLQVDEKSEHGVRDGRDTYFTAILSTADLAITMSSTALTARTPYVPIGNVAANDNASALLRVAICSAVKMTSTL